MDYFKYINWIQSHKWLSAVGATLVVGSCSSILPTEVFAPIESEPATTEAVEKSKPAARETEPAPTWAPGYEALASRGDRKLMSSRDERQCLEAAVSGYETEILTYCPGIRLSHSSLQLLSDQGVSAGDAANLERMFTELEYAR